MNEEIRLIAEQCSQPNPGIPQSALLQLRPYIEGFFDPIWLNSKLKHYQKWAKTKNRNKSSKHPDVYFADVDEIEMRQALIERDYLDYRRYTTFLRHRSQGIVQRVQGKLGFSGNEFTSGS